MLGQNSQRPADDGEFLLHFRGQLPIGHWGYPGVLDSFLELLDPLPLVPYHRNHGHAELFFESFRGNVQAAALGDVHHVERDDEGLAHLDELADEIKIALEIAGVDDDDHGIGQPGVGAQAAQDFHGHLLIGGAADEAVGAGEIDDGGEGTIGEAASAGFFFYGNTGVIGDLLAKAGEAVEDGGFSAVGISRQGDGEDLIAGFGGRFNFAAGRHRSCLTFGDSDVPGLFIAQGKVVAAEAELDWVTEWSAANDLNLGAVTEAHFEESAAEITVAAHREDKSAAADAELVQSAGIERTRVIASAEVAR